MQRLGPIWLAGAVVAGAVLQAQTPAATVAGRVTEETGAAISGARIELTHIETNESRIVFSNAEGSFAALQLPVGDYRIVIAKEGFRTLERPRLELQAEQTVRLDFKMIPGDAAARIVLTDVEITLDTEDADMGETADEEEIEETPLEGREFQNLAFQTAGVLRKSAGGTGSNFSINGARSDNTNFVLDGFYNRNVRGGGQQIKVPIDAMQEFRMQVNTYSAEYGRFGGGVMNVVLRHGANRLHGTLFEFLRNDAVDARNFFAADKNVLRRNQFGATLNGPVYLPRLYDGRNRTFFLASWESYRQRRSATRLSRVPTELERGGDFSRTFGADGKLIAARDPLGSGTFAGNLIPAERWSSVSRKSIEYYPLPNNSGAVNNYRASSRDRDDWSSFLFKVDHKLSPADSIAVRYAGRFADTTEPFAGSPFPGFGDQVDNHQTMAGVNWSRAVRKSLINDVRFGLVRTRQEQQSFRAGTNYAQMLGITGVSSDPQFFGFPRITVRDMGALGDPAANPSFFVVNNWQAQDTLSWARGAHLWKFGGELMRSQYMQDANNNLRGTFNFLGRWTNIPFADFLLGMLNNSTRQVGSYRNYLANNVWSWFVQDDWRAHRNLTVNLGMRYEMYYPPSDKYGRWTNFVPEINRQVVASRNTLLNFDELMQAANLASRIVTAEAAGLPEALVYPNRHNVAPRLGIAWRPFGAARTVLRSGYGIFYASTNLTPIRGDLGAAFPFLVKQTFTRNASQPNRLTFGDPFPEALKSLTDVNNAFGYELRPRAAYLQTWNFSVEHELGKESVLEVAYLGSKGTHLGRKYDVNQPFRSADLKTPFPRPYAGFNAIQYYAFGSNSSYQAAVVTLRRRFAGGGMLRVNYSLAKSLDYNSQISGTGDGGYGGAQDARNLRLERGRSDWDVRHAVSLNANYGLPFLARNRWLGGWRVSGVARIYSGAPFTPQTSNVQEDQGEADRPDRIAFGTAPNPSPERWFDVAAFPVVPTGAFRFGNSGRNILNGPGFVQINTGLLKIFSVREGSYFQLRVEAFNLPNHPNFEMPNVNVNAINGGTITQADDGRLIQVALKFVF